MDPLRRWRPGAVQYFFDETQYASNKSSSNLVNFDLTLISISELTRKQIFKLVGGPAPVSSNEKILFAPKRTDNSPSSTGSA
jgi:hypothetical protein